MHLALGRFSFTLLNASFYPSRMEVDLLFKQESYKIVGACFEVYKEKGCGFLEAVYQECVDIELRLQEIPFSAQPSLALTYKGRPLVSKYIPDFICYEQIVVELKAAKELTDEHRAQVQNYLKATGLQLGLLVNFGHYPKVEIERVANTKGRYKSEPRDMPVSRKDISF